MTNYGKELVLDIHNCDPAKLQQTEPHLKGDPETAKKFSVDWFGGEIVAEHLIERI